MAPLSRNQLFKIGLISLGITQREFCRQAGVSSVMVWNVLRGRSKSLRLNALIDQVISEGLRRLRPYLEEESTPQ